MKKIKWSKKLRKCIKDRKFLLSIQEEFIKNIPRCKPQYLIFEKELYYSIMLLSSVFTVKYDGVLWEFYTIDNLDNTISFVWSKNGSNNGWVGTFDEMIGCIIEDVDL